jgi:hypothetical protein
MFYITIVRASLDAHEAPVQRSALQCLGIIGIHGADAVFLHPLVLLFSLPRWFTHHFDRTATEFIFDSTLCHVLPALAFSSTY